MGEADPAVGDTGEAVEGVIGVRAVSRLGVGRERINLTIRRRRRESRRGDTGYKRGRGRSRREEWSTWAEFRRAP